MLTIAVCASFVYGGQTESAAGRIRTASDVYVLSTPAFQWFPAPSGSPRTYHDCAAAGNSQMLVVGGMDLTVDGRSSNRWETTDPWPQGLGIFDMHDLEWKDSYNADAPPYKAPDKVREWYANGYGLLHPRTLKLPPSLKIPVC